MKDEMKLQLAIIIKIFFLKFPTRLGANQVLENRKRGSQGELWLKGICECSGCAIL